MSSSSSSSSHRCIGNPNWRIIDQKTPGAGIIANVQVGDNSAGGSPEYTLTNAPAGGQREWDSNLADGFDSGEVSVCLAANAGSPGDAAWSVGGGVLQAQKDFQFIKSVEISAESQGGWSLGWSGLTATFFQNGVPVQTIIIPDECNPNANPFSQVLQIVPNSQNNTAVTVTGAVRIIGPGAPLPSSGGVSGSISLL